MKNLFIILLIIGSTTSSSFAQSLKLHSINFTIPGAWKANESNPYELGVTFHAWDKNTRLFVFANGYQRAYYPNTTLYLDTATNSFTRDERVKHRLELGDSVLQKNISTDYFGYGLKFGMTKDHWLWKIPLQTSVYLGVNLRKSEFYSSNYFLRYTDEPRLGSKVGEKYYDHRFPSEIQPVKKNKVSFSPQIGASFGIKLTANKRFSVIPRINLNLTGTHRFYSDFDANISEGYIYDLSLRSAVQFNYHLGIKKLEKKE